MAVSSYCKFAIKCSMCQLNVLIKPVVKGFLCFFIVIYGRSEMYFCFAMRNML